MKIGIIGGGAAGLMAAWLLEEEHEVILFEQKPHLGGHVDTVPVILNGKTYTVEAGFEFFSERSFPTLIRLLNTVGVPYESYDMSYTFYHSKKDSGNNSTFSKHTSSADYNESFFKLTYPHYTMRTMPTLMQWVYLQFKARNLVKNQKKDISLLEFADSLYVTQKFKEEFLYPFYAGSWGFSVSDIKEFAAYDPIKWCLKNRPVTFGSTQWYQFSDGGGAQYIKTLHAQCSKTQFHLNTSILSIQAVADGYVLKHAAGSAFVEHIILAINAYEAETLLTLVDDESERRHFLKMIEYRHTTIALHGDTSLMPPHSKDWSRVNIRFDGHESHLTTYRNFSEPQMQANTASHEPIPLFRSWIMKNQSLPQSLPSPLYAVKEYYHGKVTVDYFKAQAALQALQRRNNIWLAGIYMYDIDSHDSALRSSLTIAHQLAPFSTRLRNFTDILFTNEAKIE